MADILVEAFRLYRTHARALLITCALLFVPASLVKSCALATILAPTVRAAGAVDGTTELGESMKASRGALADAYARHAEPETIARLQRENQELLGELSQRALAVARDNPGGFALLLLGLLGTLVTAFFLYGIIVPVTNGALTIAVADRVLGGDAGWREVWALLFRRLGKLLTALIPAALLVSVGFVFFVIPGLVLALFFAFVSPVVLIEGLGGRSALRRSAELVRSDWLRVALVVVSFGLVRGAAQIVAGVFIPHSAIFFDSLFSDLLTMVLMPVPVLGIVLLYFDIRRRRDNFTSEALRADLAALKI